MTTRNGDLKTMKLIKRITCNDDSGKTYEVEHWQEQIPAGHMGNPKATIPGMSQLNLSTGESVNYIDENTFKIVQTDTIIRRV